MPASPSPASPQTAVSYRWLQPEDIHELVFYQATREAAEVGLEYIENLYQHLTEDSSVRILLDLRASGMLPFSTILSQGRQWSRRVKIHPQARLALLINHDAMLTLINPIFKLMRFGHLHTQGFQGEVSNNAVRDRAIAWLLANDTTE